MCLSQDTLPQSLPISRVLSSAVIPRSEHRFYTAVGLLLLYYTVVTALLCAAVTPDPPVRFGPFIGPTPYDAKQYPADTIPSNQLIVHYEASGRAHIQGMSIKGLLVKVSATVATEMRRQCASSDGRQREAIDVATLRRAGGFWEGGQLREERAVPLGANVLP
jgi:hypothetical protein